MRQGDGVGAGGDGIETRDALALERLVHRFAKVIDSADAAGAADVFAEGARLDLGRVVLDGLDQIAGFVAAMPSRVPGVRHVLTNVLSDGTGDPDRAAVSAYLLSLVASGAEEGALRLQNFGTYEFRATRTEGTWKLSEVTVRTSPVRIDPTP